MSSIFSSGAFGLLPMLLAGGSGSKNKNAAAAIPQATSPGIAPPVNANMNAPSNYWQGNNFTIPGYQTAPQTQVPASMLPASSSPLMRNLTAGQQGDITALTQPQAHPAPPAPQMGQQGMPNMQGLSGMMGGAQNPNIQNLLSLLMTGGARNNPSFMPPNIMNMGSRY